MSKKAQVNEQFNWLFALIAGGVILMFFMFVILQVKGASEAKTAATVINNFDGVLTGTIATPDSITILDSSPNINIDVTCEADGISEISIPDTQSKLDITQKIVFTPGTLHGDYYYSYVKPINTPFYIGNAILLADSKTIFVVWDPLENGQENQYLKEMFELLPENITKIKTPNLKDDRLKSYNKLIVITQLRFLSDPEFEDYTNDRLILTKDTNLITFKNNNQDLDFSVSQPSQRVEAFPDTTTVPNHNRNDFLQYMFFSQNFEYYMCNYNKMVRKTIISAQIYEKRTEYMKQDYAGTGCESMYDAAIDLFRKMSESATPLETIYPSELEGINNNLILASCPPIY